MNSKTKPKDQDKKTERLRALRLAREAESKEAGTWGEMAVGEITHEDTRSVFVQLWKGPRRPDPFVPGGPRVTGVAAVADWTALVGWVNERRATGFAQRTLAWNVSEAEAQRVMRLRVAEWRAAGFTIVNPLAAGGA